MLPKNIEKQLVKELRYLIEGEKINLRIPITEVIEVKVGLGWLEDNEAQYKILKEDRRYKEINDRIEKAIIDKMKGRRLDWNRKIKNFNEKMNKICEENGTDFNLEFDRLIDEYKIFNEWV